MEEALACLSRLGQIVRTEENSPSEIEVLLARIESAVHGLNAAQELDADRLRALFEALDATVRDAQRWLDEVGRPRLQSLAQFARAKRAYAPDAQ